MDVIDRSLNLLHKNEVVNSNINYIVELLNKLVMNLAMDGLR